MAKKSSYSGSCLHICYNSKHMVTRKEPEAVWSAATLEKMCNEGDNSPLGAGVFLTV